MSHPLYLETWFIIDIQLCEVVIILKIALINLRDGISKNEYPQLGLLYLASIARQKGHIVDFLDCTAKVSMH